jgi:hypothetical protein
VGVGGEGVGVGGADVITRVPPVIWGWAPLLSLALNMIGYEPTAKLDFVAVSRTPVDHD